MTGCFKIYLIISAATVYSREFLTVFTDIFTDKHVPLLPYIAHHGYIVTACLRAASKLQVHAYTRLA